MRRTIFTLTMVMFLLMLNLGVQDIMAQGPEPPPDISVPCEGCRQSPAGHWYMLEDTPFSTDTHILAPQDTGGPDNFGYTWDDSVALDWIDVSGGTETGINGNTDHVGPVDIGFPFKYYENVYSQLYISRFGFVAFNDADIYRSQSRIPSPALPNDVIAPHWVPIYELDGYVRYTHGGTAPDRWFVVEWNRLTATTPDGESAPDVYTFELILHENGDIVFQYGALNISGSHWCESSGIEDSTGMDGLSITTYCREIESNHAVHIYRPDPSARVSIPALYQGHFTTAGETNTFNITIRNTGELGADTYDLTTISDWPTELYAADGSTPLSDTDDDGMPDTGSIPQGGSTTVVVKVSTPSTVGLGADNVVEINVRSSVDTGKATTAHLQTAIPAPFAQVFRDDADEAMRLYLVQPSEQSVKKATSDSYDGVNMAVAEMPASFVYVWSKSRQLNNVYVDEIEYMFLDSEGNPTRGISKLTDHSGATVYIADYPSVAVAPDGHTGVLWVQYRYNPNTGNNNYNVFFAILDSSGDLSYGPINLTNNSTWGSWSDNGVPSFYSPRIAATGDNRFVLAWERAQWESGGRLEDIYYATRDTNGDVIKGITKFTNGIAGDDYYNNPALAALNSDRALLAYTGPSGISYAVLDSAGNTVQGEMATTGYGYRTDAVQLSNGAVLLAWTYRESGSDEIHFAVLDGTTYTVIAGPKTLNNPAAQTGNSYVSVTADGAGHGILTWTDYDYDYRRNLYYALVDSNGNINTSPMIFRTSQATVPHIETSYHGYGNTSYSDLMPPTSQAQSPEFALEPFTVTWRGSDVGSGIARYDVQVRDGADGTWTDWLEDTTAVSATYATVETGHTYYFRSVAEDAVGNVETDVLEDGDTHTTIAAYTVEGQVTNNRHQPVLNATVSAEPAALNTATSNSAGDYALYFDSSGTYTLTASRSGFGELPSMYARSVAGSLSGVDFVLPPENNAVGNGGWETGDLGEWHSAAGMTATLEMAAAHTGHYGASLRASSGTATLIFRPYVTQTLSIPSTWSRPTLSFMYRTVQGEAEDALVATVSGDSAVITHSVPLTASDWTHTWRDLRAFSGQTVTLKFGLSYETSLQHVYLDEISIGESKSGSYGIYLPLVLRNR